MKNLKRTSPHQKKQKTKENSSLVIHFENVWKSYQDKIVLHDFNLKVQKSEFITIIGSSGSGKTTALKMVNGLRFPDEGNVFVHGQNIRQANLIQLRRSIGYAIQGSALFPHMSVWENIAYVPNLWNKRDSERTARAVEHLAKLMALDADMLDRFPDELSGGQQQRVGIARALAANPDILLMDEPFGAVDEITRKNLQEEILRIHKEIGVTILFVTHDINEALKLADRVLVMDEGKILQMDTPVRLQAKPANSFVKKLIQDAKVL